VTSPARLSAVTHGKSKASAKTTSQQAVQETEQPNRVIADELIDKTLEDSFPTSDPPSWRTGRERSTLRQPNAAKKNE